MLETSSSPILNQLQTILNAHAEDVTRWLTIARRKAAPFIYSSVDLRHAGFKIAPVDTNLYPAGFNNLSTHARERAIDEFKTYFNALPKPPKRVLIIAESHTRNLPYLENLAVLSDLIAASGIDVKIGNLAAQPSESLTLATSSGRPLQEYALIRKGNLIQTSDGFIPDALVLNHDFTNGPADILIDLEQSRMPPMRMGWYNRRKSEHFTRYNALAARFARDFNFDPWLICAYFHRCGVVNFDEAVGLECVALGVEKVLHRIRRKYKDYSITGEPYVYVKADSGTYGMGVMTARSGDELLQLNKKTRNKMKTIKGGARNSEVIIQEGIPTIDRVSEAAAEPMIYLVNGHPVGGMYRSNPERDAFNNLNTTGMRFTGMCDPVEDDCNRISVAGCDYSVFSLIASLAALAAAREDYRYWDYAI